jgi:hypothetical protein
MGINRKGDYAMTEYRIAEHNRRFYIEYLDDKFWRINDEKNVPKFFDSLADARSWVATIKRGVVYHDAEDAPNLAQDERKAEKGNVIWDEWEEALARNIVRLLLARGTVNGITIHNVSIDDEYIRITT